MNGHQQRRKAEKLWIDAYNGIWVKYRGKTVHLDPKRSPEGKWVFISHAHYDHLPKGSLPQEGQKVLASKETLSLARFSDAKIKEAIHSANSFEMIDTGHILGSRGLLIDGDVYYTGDVAGRPRAFLRAAKPVNCKTLIIEATYGSPRYRFPALAEVLRRTNQLIADSIEKGKSVVLMGYPLGKCQVLTNLFSNWIEHTYIHETVERINQIYRDLGVSLPRPRGILQEAISKRGPWVAITPILRHTSRLYAVLKRKYDAVLIAFSGWAVHDAYARALGADYALPLSDHCDFYELLAFVKKCEPEYVFTCHGFARGFATELRKLGFNAQVLGDGREQRRLTDFLRED